MTTSIAMRSTTFVSGKYNPCSMMTNGKDSYCRFVKITIPADWMKYVIGNAGFYFNAITHQSKCSYIWFHKDNGVIEVWGSTSEAVDNATQRLIKRMEHICLEILTKNGMMKNGKRCKVMWADIQDDC